MINKKFDKLKQQRQTSGGSIISYFDDIVNLCQEIDLNMSEQIVIQHLLNELNSDFKKELSRRESAMNRLNEFLKYAKIEQDLHDTFEKTRDLSIDHKKLFIILIITKQFLH